jgi:Beta-glucosidase-related glycosidases
MKINSRKSFICGLKGLKLSKKEINFLRKYKPWGIILFSRNIKNIKQVQILTSKIKKIFKDQNYPILIDEEGGYVSRLNKIIDTSIFSAKSFGDLFKKDKRKFEVFFKVYVDQISYLLRNIGINLNTVPVLDVTHPKTSKVIGTRSYSTNPSTVSAIGDTCINYFHNQRIGTIIKHIPGHGLAQKDSHKIKPNC